MYSSVDTIWVLLGATLVFFMQAGFALSLIHISREFDLKVLAKLPLTPHLASICDSGVVELFEGDWMDGAADVIENLE